MKTQRKFYTYMLLCNQETFYVGITDNVKRRLSEHKDKKSFFTKKFSDIQLVYCEKYNSEKEAVNREKQLKRWRRAKKQMLVDGQLGINRVELNEVLVD